MHVSKAHSITPTRFLSQAGFMGTRTERKEAKQKERGHFKTKLRNGWEEDTARVAPSNWDPGEDLSHVLLTRLSDDSLSPDGFRA